MQVLHKVTYSNWNTANALFINISFLFDFLVAENLDKSLLKLYELILQSVHLLGLHYVLIARTQL